MKHTVKANQQKDKPILEKKHATRKQLEDVTNKVISKYSNALSDLAKR